jgi:transposase
VLFFFDEGRFGTMPTVGRCWGLRGTQVYSPVNPGYKNFYIYSSVSPHTGDSFSLFLPWVNTEMMNIYLEHFSVGFPDKHIMLIMDRAGWHCSKNLIIPGNITIELLPPYSPELNPVERLWRWLRMHVCRNCIFDSLDDLTDKLEATYKQLSPQFLSSLCRCSYLYSVN